MLHLQSLFPFLALLSSLTTSALTPPTYTYPTLTTTPLPSTNSTVLRALISNPPINLYSRSLITDLFAFLTALNSTPTPPKAVIFASANPSFWIDHIDLHLLQPPPLGPPDSQALLSTYHQTVQLLRSLPTIFIAEINGLATGAGNEIAVQMDMRFAGPNARMGSLEVALDLIHGNGGAQFLTQLIGPGRAAEYLLTGDTVDAQTAAAYGWVNRAYGSGAELTSEVNKLATRMATWPAGGLNGTKAAVRAGGPSAANLEADLATFGALLGQAEAQRAIAQFLVLSKNQTLGPFELGLNADLTELYL
ncbi:hypothetical protein MMC17_008029 [Xylographa soralifera]|nr:hypothetical protein [Xylographa soralifera]